MTKPVLVLLILATASCQSREDALLANMTGPEKASYFAIKKFDECMAPTVADAKRRHNLSNAEVHNLGYACPPELNDVALKLAARPDWGQKYRKLPPSQKIAAIKREFADHFWCKLRDCGPVL
jgi:hypothetical protein